MNDLTSPHRRVLVVDDVPAIHRVFARILAPRRSQALASDEQLLFGAPVALADDGFDVEFALTGERALELTRRRIWAGTPFDAAFVDMRMPIGWDGVETMTQLLRVQPDLEIAVCSAYADYSWHEVIARVQRPSMRLVQKPFTASDILKTAFELTQRHRDQLRRCGSQQGQRAG